MKNQLFTKHSFLGMLMGLVLAFSVSGIADAAHLPLSKTSGDLQTESVGEPFEITFSVGVRSNTTAIKNDQNQLTDEDGNLIDSAGYQVAQSGNRLLRTTTVTSATDLNERPSDHSEVQELQAGNTYVSYTGEVRADSSRNAYSDDGRALYFFRAADTTADPVVTQSRIRARITESEFSTKEPTTTRYHYNEESITITVKKDAGDFAAPATDTMTFKLKASGFQNPVTSFTENPGNDSNAIPRSVTLICTPGGTSTPGTYTVRITDATPPKDTPWRNDTNTPSRAYIDFTLRVVDESDVVTGITVPEDDIFYGGGNPSNRSAFFPCR